MISENEQETTDYDWFGVDEDGHIGHFTTAGFKLLPKSVAASAEDLQTITDYFWRIEPAVDGCQVSANLEKELGPFENDQKRTQYLSSFCEMANRGLYSFDIDTYIKPELAYFCVASPSHPLGLKSLPSDIRTIISRTFLRGIRLMGTSRINYEFTLRL